MIGRIILTTAVAAAIALGVSAPLATAAAPTPDDVTPIFVEWAAANGTPVRTAVCTQDADGPFFCYGLLGEAADGLPSTGILLAAAPNLAGVPISTFLQTIYEPVAGGLPSLGGAATFGSGTVLVGVDIEPGTYRTDADEGCYWERLGGVSGDFDDLIANDFIAEPGQALVEISESDFAFASNGCGTWEKIG